MRFPALRCLAFLGFLERGLLNVKLEGSVHRDV